MKFHILISNRQVIFLKIENVLKVFRMILIKSMLKRLDISIKLLKINIIVIITIG